jgi:signal transduction histidine kinase
MPNHVGVHNFHAEDALDIFDTRTALLISGLLYLLMPLLVWLGLKDLKLKTVVLWCVGGELFGIGLLVTTMRGHVPDWMSYETASICIHLGNMLRIQALRTALGTPFTWKLFAMICGVPIIGYEVMRWFDNEATHFIWSALWVSVECIWIALHAKRLGQQQQLRTAYWLGIAYLPMAITLTARAYQVMSETAHPGLLANDYLPLAIALSGILAAVLGNTGFMGMFVEWASRQQVKQAIQKASREEMAGLARQITHLDRQRSIGLISMSLAHELGQPMTNIHLSAQCALMDVSGNPAELEKYLKSIMLSSDTAMGILERIRQFVKARPVEHHTLNMQHVIKNATDLMRDWLASEKVNLQIHAPETPLMVQGDSVQLTQILVNLIRNAAQATAGQGQRHIDIKLQSDESQVQVQVIDNGPGFSEQALANTASIFTTKTDGLGMGLTISRHIAEQHGGSIHLGNHDVRGAVSTLSLPRQMTLISRNFRSPHTPAK